MVQDEMIYKLSEFSLNFRDEGSLAFIGSFKRLDNIKLRIKLMYGDNPIILKGDKIIRFYANTPKTNTPVYQETGITIVRLSPAIIEITLKNCISNEAGTVVAELEIINPDGTLVTSNIFKFAISDKLNALDSGEEVGDCIEFLKEIREFVSIIKPEEEERKQEEYRRIEAELLRDDYETERKAAEALRVSAEESRVSSDTERQEIFEAGEEGRKTTFETNEESRQSTFETNEGIMQQNENIRKTAEANRTGAETTRVNQENSRKNAETTRANTETNRVNAEASRANVEINRVNAEASRVGGETNRVTAENSRVDAETARVNQENSREAAEAERVGTESTRANQEMVREANEADRQKTIADIQIVIDTVITDAEIDAIIANALKR